MIACKNYLWLVGRRSVEKMDEWSIVGFIASRSNGWFVSLLIGRLEVWTISGWLAGWFVCYLVCRTVVQSL
jgi:hypothetical protein